MVPLGLAGSGLSGLRPTEWQAVARTADATATYAVQITDRAAQECCSFDLAFRRLAVTSPGCKLGTAIDHEHINTRTGPGSGLAAGKQYGFPVQ